MDGMGYKRPWPANLASSFSFHSFFFSIAFFYLVVFSWVLFYLLHSGGEWEMCFFVGLFFACE
jgi:hypothetical protein